MRTAFEITALVMLYVFIVFITAIVFPGPFDLPALQFLYVLTAMYTWLGTGAAIILYLRPAEKR